MHIIGHISQLATFTKLQSPIKFHTLHFSIFPLEILNTASQLILAVNYRLQFFNFDFDVILVQFFEIAGRPKVQQGPRGSTFWLGFKATPFLGPKNNK